MTHQNRTPPGQAAIPPSHAAPPPPPPASRAQWTPTKQRIFLAALLETGSVARAARAAGMSRSSAHRLRTRLAGTPFDRSWASALALHARRLADPFGSPDASGPVSVSAPAPQSRTGADRPAPRASRSPS